MPEEERWTPARPDQTFDTLMAEMLEQVHYASLAAGLAGAAVDRVERLCVKAELLREKAKALTEKAEAWAMRVEAAAGRARSTVVRAESACLASKQAADRVGAETQRVEQRRIQAAGSPSPSQAARTQSRANNSSASPLPLSATDNDDATALDDLLAQVLALSQKAEGN